MNQIIYLLILFSLLYLIETRAINILLAFVAIIISLAFILPTITSNVESIESEYYSYILILVQVSALTILFGFIIMLFPNLSHSTPKTLSDFKLKTLEDNNIKQFEIKKNSFLNIIKYISIIISSLIILYLATKYNIKSLFNSLQLLTYILPQRENPGGANNYTNIQDILNNINNSDTLFLRKLGLNLYSIDHNIIKLIILTIILLLAIISLFFLIFA